MRNAGQILRGTLRSWKDPWGFIVCPSAFDGDLFAHKGHFVGQVPSTDLTGLEVEFVRSADEKGRAHALDIRILGNRSNGFESPTTRSMQQPRPAYNSRSDHQRFVAPSIQFEEASSPSNRANADKLSTLVGVKMRGEVRKWKGDWGFITSQKFEGDLFVHREGLQLNGEPTSGMKVSFTVAIDSKGRTAAAEVREPIAAPQDFVDHHQDLYGQIRSWRKDWGFIVAPEHFEGDLFCHQGELVGHEQMLSRELEVLAVNRPVNFQVAIDSRGRVCAREVRFADDLEVMPRETAPAVSSKPYKDFAPRAKATTIPDKDSQLRSLIGIQLQGQIRSWKDDWGFVMSPDNFEGDLFVHKGSLENGVDSLMTGVYVDFQVGVDSKERIAAFHVRCVTEPKDWAGTGARIVGRVRSWKEPFGFLVSPGAFAGDLFCHMGNLSPSLKAQGLQNGEEVSFMIDEDKGKIAAKDVQLASHSQQLAKRGPQSSSLPPSKRPRR